MADARPPKVYVVDDDAPMRESLTWLIGSVGLEVETFADAAAFLDTYRAEDPGCLVLDVRLPGMNGTELQREMAGRGMTLPIIFITGHGEVQVATRVMKAGAIDLLEKPFSHQDLLDRIHEALELDQKVRDRHARKQASRKVIECLSNREREVLELVLEGSSSREIGEKLGISRRTVEAHRAHMMEKTGAGSLVELMRIAMAAGT
ncbi:MAG: response regulator transcription factor [Leptospirillia bacterium]